MFTENTLDYNYYYERVRETFFALSFKMKLLGSKYLFCAILECCLDEKAERNLSARVYPEIARKFDTTPVCVEHAIRNAIRDCYNSENLFGLNEMYKSQIVSKTYQPTNCELIAAIASCIRGERFPNGNFKRL